MTGAAPYVYFPALVCQECDSPIDALIGVCVGQREAMDLVVASWTDPEMACLLASVDGGRQIVVTRLPGGRWAASHPRLTHPCTSFQEAERQLQKIRRYQTRGMVVKLALSILETAAAVCSTNYTAFNRVKEPDQP